MKFRPHKIYTPTKTTDGVGGFTEAEGAGASRTIWGAVVVHKKEVLLVVRRQEPVHIGDIVTVKEET